MGLRRSWRGGPHCKCGVLGLSRFESYQSHINFASIVQRLVYDPSKVEMSVRFRLLAQVAARLDVSPASYAGTVNLILGGTIKQFSGIFTINLNLGKNIIKVKRNMSTSL